MESMILAEKTPLGKVTKSVYLVSFNFVTIHIHTYMKCLYTAAVLTIKKPGSTRPNQRLPVVLHHQPVWNALFDRTTTIQSGIEHAHTEVENR